MSQITSIRRALALLPTALLALMAEALAFASNGVSIPDPSAATLLALGVVGLIVGRQSGRRPPKD
jgi:VIT1/CCC1 family predicted Fe2+/Mn2+ transporter